MSAVPTPRTTGKAWADATGYTVAERPNMLLVWQDDEDNGRVFLVPHHLVPLDWIETLTYAKGCYLESDQKYGIDDTVTSLVRLLMVMVWPQHSRRLKSIELPLAHTESVYRVRAIARSWLPFMVKPAEFGSIDRRKLALVVRTGRAPPREQPLPWS